ncbi:winged helix DNA-binding domain-containing protein [Actinoplanes sp. CA-051413]|uniref:winged helix DNA-binding domain-containing protein n=1 Tax=Actinoplanes sp. CA-051413 TaxID=3239899 RepID=UPI003D9928EE
MKLDEILRRRIDRHHLGSTKAGDVVAAARRVGGLHAQVASSALASATLRLGTEPDLEAALYRQKSLVRTWAARGTLHLLPAADLPLWVAAMSTRTRETTGSWLKFHGVTAEQMRDIIAALPDLLGATPLTREELAGAIIEATGHEDLRGPLIQGFGAILKPLAFRGLLCSGPPRGRHVTFVAPRAWLGDWEPVPAEDAIDQLVLHHLDAYGPADAAEFARWFDLKPPLAKKSFARLADRLRPVGDEGFLPIDAPDAGGGDTVLLLPAFDPYVVGSLRRLETVSSGPKSAVSRPQGWISPTLVVNGRIEGVWELADGHPVVTPFAPLSAATRRALPEGSVIR